MTKAIVVSTDLEVLNRSIHFVNALPLTELDVHETLKHAGYTILPTHSSNLSSHVRCEYTVESGITVKCVDGNKLSVKAVLELTKHAEKALSELMTIIQNERAELVTLPAVSCAATFTDRGDMVLLIKPLVNHPSIEGEAFVYPVLNYNVNMLISDDYPKGIPLDGSDGKTSGALQSLFDYANTNRCLTNVLCNMINGKHYSVSSVGVPTIHLNRILVDKIVLSKAVDVFSDVLKSDDDIMRDVSIINQLLVLQAILDKG